MGEVSRARKEAVLDAYRWSPDAQYFNLQGYDKTKSDIASAIAARQGVSAPTAQAAQAAGFNTQAQDQIRAQQMGMLSQLGQAAAGQGPSVAQGQFQRNLDQAIAAQRAQAASARGVSPGLAQRMAQQGIAQLTGQAAGDAAQLRAQEQVAARGQLADALSGVRGQDIGAAQGVMQGSQFNAGLTQQAALANQQANLQNQAGMDQYVAQLMQMGLSADQAQTQANIAYQQMQAQLAQTLMQGNFGITQSQQAGNAGMKQALVGGALSAGGAALGGLLG